VSSNPPANDAGLRYYVVANNKVLLHDVNAGKRSRATPDVARLRIVEPPPKATLRKTSVSRFKEA